MRQVVTVRELEAFVCLAEHLNFKVAAEHTHVSQPALTRIVQATELKLGAKLFDRNTRRVELTPFGRELLPSARRILADFSGALNELSDFIGGKRGNISVACLPSAAASLLPPVMAQLQRTHPNLTIALHPTSGQLFPEMLKSGTADFAISGKSVDPELAFEGLLKDPLVLICSAKESLPAQKADLRACLAKRPLISSGASSSVRPVVERFLIHTGVTIAPRYEVANISVLGAMVAAGIGISIVPAMALRLMDLSRINVYHLDPPETGREIGILTRKGRTLSSASLYFIERLRQAARSVSGRKRKTIDSIIAKGTLNL